METMQWGLLSWAPKVAALFPTVGSLDIFHVCTSFVDPRVVPDGTSDVVF